MNLVLARGCSNSCAYCFETAEREKGRAELISMEKVTEFAQWARASRLEFLQLVGGEPFLHPQLAEIVSVFRSISPGTRLMVLTGGVFNKRLLDDLAPEDAGLAFNINEPRDYRNPKHLAKVIGNAEAAIRKGFRVVLSFNVWRLDFDTAFMPAVAHRLARTSFRWAVANPQRDFPSSVVAPADFRALAGRCFDMLQEAARLGIEARLDCPVPLCFFSDAQLGWTRQYHPGTSQRMGCCGPALDVTPELEVIRCFALSRLVRVKLTDYRSEGEIANWFLANIEPQLLDRGVFAECAACPHFKAGRCYGGCLAWHKGAVDTEAGSIAMRLAMEMGAAIDGNRPDLALNEFARANYWAKAALPTFEAAVASSRLGKKEQVFRYAAYAHDMDPAFNMKDPILEMMSEAPARDAADLAVPPAEKGEAPFVANPGGGE